MRVKSKKNAVHAWLDELQASGRYTFTADEQQRAGPGAERTSLWRAQREGRLAQLRTGFFVIIPPEYRAVGAPPAPWFIDELMRFEEQPYYVGLLSAASLHGASAQAVQEFQVVVPVTLRPIRAGRLRIHFIQRSDHDRAITERRQTPTGAMQISTPEQTVLDVARYPIVAGGWDNVAAVVRDLAPSIDPKKLVAAARAQDDVRSIQRLGYLLEQFAEAEEPARALATSLVRRAPRYVALDPRAGAENAERDERWHLLVNRTMEPD
jgi:predicted transcriptional regulator of viral defense system